MMNDVGLNFTSIIRSHVCNDIEQYLLLAPTKKTYGPGPMCPYPYQNKFGIELKSLNIWEKCH